MLSQEHFLSWDPATDNIRHYESRATSLLSHSQINQVHVMGVGYGYENTVDLSTRIILLVLLREVQLHVATMSSYT